MQSSSKIKQSREYWDNLSWHDVSCSVLDPNDTLGYKNYYIRSIALSALHEALSELSSQSQILDFGCGTGQNFSLLKDMKLQPIGMDISFPLLYQAINHGEPDIPCIQYDGNNIPLSDSSVHAILTFSVLIYLVDDNDLAQCLKEMHRILIPGGRAIVIEQMTRNDRLSTDSIKYQRNRNHYQNLFAQAGFTCQSSTTLRRGHFPLLYLIRYGLLPKVFFPHLAKLEKWIGNIAPDPVLDYTDTMFILEKRHGSP